MSPAVLSKLGGICSSAKSRQAPSEGVFILKNKYGVLDIVHGVTIHDRESCGCNHPGNSFDDRNGRGLSKPAFVGCKDAALEEEVGEFDDGMVKAQIRDSEKRILNRTIRGWGGVKSLSMTPIMCFYHVKLDGCSGLDFARIVTR